MASRTKGLGLPWTQSQAEGPEVDPGGSSLFRLKRQGLALRERVNMEIPFLSERNR